MMAHSSAGPDQPTRELSPYRSRGSQESVIVPARGEAHASMPYLEPPSPASVGPRVSRFAIRSAAWSSLRSTCVLKSR